jgi:hypothetical protein
MAMLGHSVSPGFVSIQIDEPTHCGEEYQALRGPSARLEAWEATDELGDRAPEIAALLGDVRPGDDISLWAEYSAPLPLGMQLGELRDFLWADNPARQERVLANVYQRLEQPVPEDHLLPSRVQVMTMHGAKGLSAQVVFVPGLEEDILPGAKRQPYPGLVREAARLLYVSLTRARATCVVSMAGTRMVHGQFNTTVPSQFSVHLGGTFEYREGGLSDSEVTEIVTAIGDLF